MVLVLLTVVVPLQKGDKCGKYKYIYSSTKVQFRHTVAVLCLLLLTTLPFKVVVLQLLIVVAQAGAPKGTTFLIQYAQ